MKENPDRKRNLAMLLELLSLRNIANVNRIIITIKVIMRVIKIIVICFARIIVKTVRIHCYYVLFLWGTSALG